MSNVSNVVNIVTSYKLRQLFHKKCHFIHSPIAMDLQFIGEYVPNGVCLNCCYVDKFRS